MKSKNSSENILEGWIAGASMDYFGRVTGLFYQTIDGGLTYKLQQVFLILLLLFILFFYVILFLLDFR